MLLKKLRTNQADPGFRLICSAKNVASCTVKKLLLATLLFIKRICSVTLVYYSGL